ncbi:MAG: biotin transporter BioY [Acidobacteria bacterium]|nr:biotin transporter BioY [Acidobacteriota bacterium]
MALSIDKPKIKITSIPLFYDVLMVVSASLLIGLFSQFELILPFSPVPLTLQTFAVLLCGILLGKTKGALSVLLYLAEGALGLPFFAGGGFGVHHIFGPTGGYLLGFICAAYLAGFFIELGYGKSYFKMFLALIISNFSIYLFGLAYLSSFVGRQIVLQTGLYPFLLSDIVKIVFLSLSYPLLSRIIKVEEDF